MKQLKDRVAVVTGAASGIGQATAVELARAGMDVVLADVDEEGMERTAQQIVPLGRQSWSCRTDVSSTDDLQRLRAVTLDKAGAVHVLFNNAGIVRFSAALEMCDDDWRRVIELDLFGIPKGSRYKDEAIEFIF